MVCNDIEYSESEVSAECVDAVGCLEQQAANKVKEMSANNNAAEVMKGVDAVIFTGGEDISPSLLATPQPWHGIEAIERTDKTLAIGLQFHPEAAMVKHIAGSANKDSYMTMVEAKKLINSFVSSVKARKVANN